MASLAGGWPSRLRCSAKRRMRDLNPRRVSPYTTSNRAPSATRRILRAEVYRSRGGWRDIRPVGASGAASDYTKAQPLARRYLANPPRAGRQQGYASSGGCAGGPFPLVEGEHEPASRRGPRSRRAWPSTGSTGPRPSLRFAGRSTSRLRCGRRSRAAGSTTLTSSAVRAAAVRHPARASWPAP